MNAFTTRMPLMFSCTRVFSRENCARTSVVVGRMLLRSRSAVMKSHGEASAEISASCQFSTASSTAAPMKNKMPLAPCSSPCASRPRTISTSFVIRAMSSPVRVLWKKPKDWAWIWS